MNTALEVFDIGCLSFIGRGTTVKTSKRWIGNEPIPKWGVMDILNQVATAPVGRDGDAMGCVLPRLPDLRRFANFACRKAALPECREYARRERSLVAGICSAPRVI